MKQEQTFFDMSPKSMAEAQAFAEIFVKSIFCPKYLQGKPGDALMVLQLGSELGLKPMQSFKTLGCINGLPFAYGDGKLALVKSSPHYHSIKEWSTGSLEKGDLTAFCTAKRKNGEENTRSFSMAQAKRAGLLGKPGPWTQYTERMLMMRARVALNDTFADVLFGLISEDEAYEIVEKEKGITPKTVEKGIAGLKQALNIGNQKPETTVIEHEPENQTIEPEHYYAEEPEFIPPELATPQQVCDLKNLIMQYGISDNLVEKWINKAHATCFEEMQKDVIQSCIDWAIEKNIGA